MMTSKSGKKWQMARNFARKRTCRALSHWPLIHSFNQSLNYTLTPIPTHCGSLPTHYVIMSKRKASPISLLASASGSGSNSQRDPQVILPGLGGREFTVYFQRSTRKALAIADAVGKFSLLKERTSSPFALASSRSLTAAPSVCPQSH